MFLLLLSLLSNGRWLEIHCNFVDFLFFNPYFPRRQNSNLNKAMWSCRPIDPPGWKSVIDGPTDRIFHYLLLLFVLLFFSLFYFLPFLYFLEEKEIINFESISFPIKTHLTWLTLATFNHFSASSPPLSHFTHFFVLIH